jgi:hypothetical protein
MGKNGGRIPVSEVENEVENLYPHPQKIAVFLG